jgi:D-arginine dehydrogenase
VAGFSDEGSGFFWLAGQGGYGIQTAPALSRAAAALIVGAPLPEDLQSLNAELAALSPRRFAAFRG